MQQTRQTGRSMRAGTSVALALTCAACAFPMSVYVAEPQAGTPVYERCSFNANVPVGVSVDGSGIQVLVSVTRRFGRGYVEARYDVPPGRTVTFDRNALGLDRHDGAAPEALTFLEISPSGIAAYSPDDRSLALRRLALPVNQPLVGGFSSPGIAKHYWIAAPFDTEQGRDLWITLPPVTVNGVPAAWPTIHFRQQTMIATIGSNC